MEIKKIRIGTRGSELALWQANYFQTCLSEKGLGSEIKEINTQGDLIQNIGFDKLEGKGFFTREIENALSNNEIDIAVHSMKDLPTEQPEGLVIGGISSRANAQDLLIIDQNSVDKNQLLLLKKNAVIGTSSIRRKVLLRSFRPDFSFKDIRGNVPTRIQKLLEDSDLDAIILAAAGIDRLQIDLSEFKVIKLNPREFPCAPAQGVLAYQCRKNDMIHRRLLQSINEMETLQCTNVERKILKLMEGGCNLPLGAYCERDAVGNYHCFSAFAPSLEEPVKFVKMSQTTTSKLAERIVTQLKIKKTECT